MQMYDAMKGTISICNKKAIEEMSNKLTDMALDGASEDEIKEAINHSMEVIDEMKEQDKVKRYSGRYPWGTK